MIKMNMIDKIRALWRSPKPNSSCIIKHESDGSGFVFPNNISDLVVTGKISTLMLQQYVHLRQLNEEGYATEIPGGFSLSPLVLASSDDSFRHLFGINTAEDLEFNLDIVGVTSRTDFYISSSINHPEYGSVPYRLKGAKLSIGKNQSYILTHPQYTALHAIKEHQSLTIDKRTECINLSLVKTLQHSVALGFNSDLKHFRNLEVVMPHKVGIGAIMTQSGELQLVPCFDDIDAPPEEILQRRHQIVKTDKTGVLRVGKRLVVLKEQTMSAVNEIFGAGKITKENIQQFLETPTAFINAELVDLDTGFSQLVIGASRYQKVPLGELDSSGISWFDRFPDPLPPAIGLASITDNDSLKQVEHQIMLAKEKGFNTIVFAGKPVDISSANEVEKVLNQIRSKIHEPPPEKKNDANVLEKVIATVEIIEEGNASGWRSTTTPQWSRIGLKRIPLQHQIEGINWLTELLEGAFSNPVKSTGALLADDMGLGKTFQTLVAIRHYIEYTNEQKCSARPILVVAPLSLLQNWEEEVHSTFDNSPFERIVTLQNGQDLEEFRIIGSARETRQEFGNEGLLTENQIRYALKVGGFGRLDMPNRLVLCSYQTLRDFQFSLCRIDWGIVIFDEAQNVKDPNSLQSRAANGLKSKFKLMLTGTPVENSLLDCWSIMNIACPGLLGNLPEFRSLYMKPIISADILDRPNVRVTVGRKLRKKIGDLMLRRLKEDELPGLPKKILVSPWTNESEAQSNLPQLGITMKGLQLRTYDEILLNSTSVDRKKKGWALEVIQQLRACSLHANLVASKKTLVWENSDNTFAKLDSLIHILKWIQARGEKGLVFVISKALQRELSVLLSQEFRIQVDIINGETSTEKKNEENRLNLIRRLSQQPGFGVMILSPIAAGVGLNITCANHVIHLERHWNPAKEAQATDRCYRIGQQKNVTVWYPASLHPKIDSFDMKLHQLLKNKTALKDCLISLEPDADSELCSLI